MSAAYRVRQFVQAARAWVKLEAKADEAVISPLPDQAVRLFMSMPRYDRAHALRVTRALQSAGRSEPDLLAAALLHDVGKTVSRAGRLFLWHRVAVVLVRGLYPGLLERMGQDRPGGWRQAFYVQQHHAAIGAEQAQRAGCSPVAVELIRRHEDPLPPPGDPLLAALKAADNAN